MAEDQPETAAVDRRVYDSSVGYYVRPDVFPYPTTGIGWLDSFLQFLTNVAVWLETLQFRGVKEFERQEVRRQEEISLWNGWVKNNPVNTARVIRSAKYSRTGPTAFVNFKEFADSEDNLYIKRRRDGLINSLIASLNEIGGYEAVGEGWMAQFPGRYHIDLGLVDLTPRQEDLPVMIVNTVDNQVVDVDVRFELIIIHPVAKIVRIGSDQKMKKFVEQKIQVLVNSLTSQLNITQATRLGEKNFNKILRGDDIDVVGKCITVLVKQKGRDDTENEVPYYLFADVEGNSFKMEGTDDEKRKKHEDQENKKVWDGITELDHAKATEAVLMRVRPYLWDFNWEMAHYGINFSRLELQKVWPPHDIRDAAEQERVMEFTRKSAKLKGESVANYFKEAGIQPGWQQALIALGDVLVSAKGGGIVAGRFGGEEEEHSGAHTRPARGREHREEEKEEKKERGEKK